MATKTGKTRSRKATARKTVRKHVSRLADPSDNLSPADQAQMAAELAALFGFDPSNPDQDALDTSDSPFAVDSDESGDLDDDSDIGGDF